VGCGSSADPTDDLLVEAFKERESPVAGQEIHKIARDAVQAIEDAGARGRSCRSSCGDRCLRCGSGEVRTYERSEALLQFGYVCERSQVI
jgi:hypothetical protein